MNVEYLEVEIMSYRATVVAGPAANPGAAAPAEMTFEMPNPRAETTEVTTAFTGGHLLHLAVAACVANDVFREAQLLEIPVDSVRVAARGDFAGTPVVSTGISYSVDVSSGATEEDIARLLRRVDEVAEIPATLRAATSVTRTDWR